MAIAAIAGIIGAVGATASAAKSLSSGGGGGAPSASAFPATFANKMDQGQTDAEKYLQYILFGKGAETTTYPTYQGPVAAGVPNASQMSLQGLEDAIGGSAGAAKKAGATQGAGLDYITKLLTRGPADDEAYFKSAIEDPARRGFSEQTLPTLLSALGGNVGGPRSTTAAVAGSRAARDLDTSLIGSREQLSRDRIAQQLSGAQLIPNLAASPTKSLTDALAGGTVFQQGQQANIDAQIKGYQLDRAAYQKQVDDILRYLGIGTQAENNTVVNPGSANPFGNFIGSASSPLLQRAGNYLGDKIFGPSKSSDPFAQQDIGFGPGQLYPS